MKRAASVDVIEGPQKKRVKTVAGEESSTKSADLHYSIDAGRAVDKVPFQLPQQLLTFSYTPEHVLEFTDSALRYFVHPPNGADLRYGYERWVKRPEEKGRIDNLLRAVSRTRQKMSSGNVSGSDWLKTIGVVSWRGVMTKEDSNCAIRRARWMGPQCNALRRDLLL